MTKTYAQIQKQIETLQREADKVKRKEVEDVIARIKEAVRIYGLTAGDLGLGGSPSRKRGSSSKRASPQRSAKARSAAKYRDPAGNTWGGRGPRPRWLREALASGKSLQEFAV
jgi:DNA-binding protein H-NS